MKKILIILLSIVAISLAQINSNQVWKYSDTMGSERSGWNDTEKYFEWTTTGVDSVTSIPFYTREDWHGLLMLACQVDTGETASGIRFKLHHNDGIGWIERGYLTFWLWSDSSSTISTFNGSSDGKRYYWTSYHSDEDKGLESLPVEAFRVEAVSTGAGTYRIKMTWDEF